ncbi:hypothetical protein CI109_102231 [Kwoniella shandongensis]|uniref:Uncharacterized protein n=1 Tax=Kwoniella shandongensis TaxID=1734106 RepID=A0A5M6C001_9TREE|nr:uncharacterized protein CI109_003615 [Kwoniella shandongensis]KAA5527961.1 hypothetical protein CI109_003615 [Kwoniella shandongensis]
MASLRALLRTAGFQPIPLPSSSRPQFVNDDGYEYDPEEQVEAVTEDAGDVIAAEEEEGDEDAEEVDEVVEIDEDVVMGEEDQAEGDEGGDIGGEEQEDPKQEPLLSIAESLVLPYSLTQTRHHHLTSLLPHIFTHPPIPSHSKPRARPPPKGTFLFPTPPPLVHPLPSKEYHGPLKPVEVNMATTPNEGDPSTSTPPPASATKPARQPKPKKISDEAEPPAHEIECISRCTLSVGPVSFPGTEVWIGRFVEPRETRPKKERARPGERKEKRKSLAEETASRRARRARPKPSATGSTEPGTTPRLTGVSANKVAGPSYRPPPGGPRPVNSNRPIPQSNAPPNRPPHSTTSTPARPTASPQLIQLVNQAATRHPWLSALIYKAAGSTANQEELERLGKAVARLSRGEPIADLAPAGAAPTSSAPTQAVAGPGPSSQVRPPPAPMPQAAATTSTSLADAPSSVQPATTAPEEDSDGEVDMSGRPQVGGGPLPIPPNSELQRTTENGSTAGTSQTPIPPPTSMPPPVAIPVATPLQPAASTPVNTQVTQSPALPPNQTYAPSPSTALNPALHTPYPMPTTPAPRISSPTPPPPPTKPTYQLPPPFLLIAFKEQPTEKYLIPLGTRSFISRMGGDYVTGPAPPPTPEPVQIPQVEVKPDVMPPPPVPQATSTDPSSAIVQTSLPAVGDAPATTIDPVPIVGKPSRGRTRASLGRHAKDLPPIAAPTVEPLPVPVQPEEPVITAQPPVESKPRERPTSGLPPLPGMKPDFGTVLVSTFVPVGKWEKVDWEAFGKRLPFENQDFWIKPNDPTAKTVEVKEEPKEALSPIMAAPSTPLQANPTGSKRDLRHPRLSTSTADAPADTSSHTKPKPTGPQLLNLAVEDLIPDQEPVQALTIRLSGIDDAVWKKIKGVMEEVERVDMEVMAKDDPELVKDEEDKPEFLTSTSGQVITPVRQDGQAAPQITPVVAPPSLPPGLFGLSTRVLEVIRPIYLAKKKALFSSLLKRVPPRTFLTTRLPPPPPPELVDATTDKWAPRPYPISTKPLYTVEADDQDDEGPAAEIQLSPEPSSKGKKRKAGETEPEVMFEMPVSLEALDERVEEGAKKGLGRKNARGSGAGPIKRKTKRGVEKGICEGCAREGIKVWRRGPTGKGTLCNACGDLYTTGKLGELKAPGAMKPFLGEDDDEEGDGDGKAEEGDEDNKVGEGKVEEDVTEENNKEADQTVRETDKEDGLEVVVIPRQAEDESAAGEVAENGHDISTSAEIGEKNHVPVETTTKESAVMAQVPAVGTTGAVDIAEVEAPHGSISEQLEEGAVTARATEEKMSLDE